MGQAMILRRGGGGSVEAGALTVVGGTSVPGSPAANTLWVSTSTAIGKLAVQGTEPATIGGVALVDGDVWVQTTRRSTWKLVHNCIAYCGAYVYTYSGSAWVIATYAAYYDGAAWKITNDANTILMIHADPDDAKTGWYDASLLEGIITNVGAELSTAQYKFAPYSIGVAADKYLRGPQFPFAKTAFTIEMWARLGSYHAVNMRTLFSIATGTPTNATVITVGVQADGTVIMDFGSTTSDSAATFSTGEWHHVALVGNGGADGARTCKVYIDGTIYKTATINYNIGNYYFYAGYSPDFTTGVWPGNIQEIRISNVQRWTENFTPPAYAYV
jgi:hypothetical protein